MISNFVLSKLLVSRLLFLQLLNFVIAGVWQVQRWVQRSSDHRVRRTSAEDVLLPVAQWPNSWWTPSSKGNDTKFCVRKLCQIL